MSIFLPSVAPVLAAVGKAAVGKAAALKVVRGAAEYGAKRLLGKIDNDDEIRCLQKFGDNKSPQTFSAFFMSFCHVP